ncbi:hypothetical protein LUZ60_003749 [Juncus effusus]|nr:hypothetical protein LUZ60_003749 [Juncus effusus]
MKRGKGGGGGGGVRNGLLPSSLRIISSCLKTVSSNAGSVASTVRSAGATVAASIAAPPEDEKDQVLWAGFDRLELSPSTFKNVLLIGYSNGFQVVDVDDASNVCELVSKRDGPVTFLQMQPVPDSDSGLSENEGFRASHPMLLVVAGDETNGSGTVQGGRLSALIRDNNNSNNNYNNNEAQQGNCISTPTVVRFYSLKSNSYVHVLRFRSAVYIVRCSPRIVAVALAAQIYCFDAVTLESKFSVLTYPLQATMGVNIGYGPMSVGPRWLAYSTNSPLLSTTGRLSPQNLTPSPGVSPSTSPGNGNLVARYAMESSKQLAAGIIGLGDMGYKTLSKYCQDLMPDGSNSPLSSSPGRRSGRLPASVHPVEADNAGTVVIKDFISKEVISQFRAHTSPISALCFDPSGTLLVTASVHGHNINVFRILPTAVSNGSGGSPRYDWASSHVHLYKLYRGLTAAVIQDFCFSSFSQWVAIVSSRGTCHIFTLSPFGGDSTLQIESNYSTDRASLSPKLSRPWWANSSFLKDQQFYPPPPAVTLSVVSRIKNGNSGWLNTVSNVAATATGKASVPSGALAAVFHNSILRDSNSPKNKPLEYLLVYSPSGYVIQHELVPSNGVESADISPRITGSGLQEDELRVSAEPVQWWDVCRRSNWPERDENISRVIFSRQNSFAGTENVSDCEESNDIYNSAPGVLINGNNINNGGKGQERPHWYLSNAEVQINSGRIPIWQKSKICFYVVNLNVEGGISEAGGEIEIEKLAVQEIEIRRRELLPVFEQFHYSQQDVSDRAHIGGRFHSVKENGVIPQSKPVFLRSDSLNSPRSPRPSQETNGQLIPNPTKSTNSQTFPSESDQTTNILSPVNNMPPSLLDTNIMSSNGNNNQDSNVRNNNENNDNNENGEKSSVEFTQYFHEGYCKIGGGLDESRELTDDSNSSHKEDQDNDDVIGGIFAFSEEDLKKCD